MKKINIGIIAFTTGKAGKIPTSNLLDIISYFSNCVHFIRGGTRHAFSKKDKKIHIHEVRHDGGKNVFTRVIKYIYTQLKISYTVIKTTRDIEIWIFFIGGDTLVLPMLLMKLLKKKVILAFAGSATDTLKSANDSQFKLVKFLSNINCTLSNSIVLYSPNLIREWNLEKYRYKIHIAHKHFLDLKEFKPKKKFDERDILVGYIGRLSEEKGSMNFIKAIPAIISKKSMIRFLMGGEGSLINRIEAYLEENNLKDKVKLAGWIPHDELSEYLNELKLIILPSYTEGLPNIMLEAMACGTPVLATSVGSIPDVITDEETGFIMEDNSPECIAENVVRVLNHPNLNKIASKAREFVEKEFTYEAAVEKYKKIIDEIQR